MPIDTKGITGSNFGVQALNAYRNPNTDGPALSFQKPSSGSSLKRDGDTVTISDAVRKRIAAATSGGTASGAESGNASGTANGTTSTSAAMAATVAETLAAAKAAGESGAGTQFHTDMDTEMVAFSRAQLMTNNLLQTLNTTHGMGAEEANGSDLAGKYSQNARTAARAILDDLA